MHATKTVRAVKVEGKQPVSVRLDRDTEWALDYARQYLIDLPGLLKEVEEAAEVLMRTASHN